MVKIKYLVGIKNYYCLKKHFLKKMKGEVFDLTQYFDIQ
jgi:hypothetical protein